MSFVCCGLDGSCAYYDEARSAEKQGLNQGTKPWYVSDQSFVPGSEPLFCKENGMILENEPIFRYNKCFVLGSEPLVADKNGIIPKNEPFFGR